MSDLRVPLIIAIALVATVIFVLILRSNRARDERGRAEAAERGETVAPRKVSPTVIYLVLGLAFVAIGLFEVLRR